MELVPPTRIERATRGLGNRCSIQLSYGGLEENVAHILNGCPENGGGPLSLCAVWGKVSQRAAGIEV